MVSEDLLLLIEMVDSSTVDKRVEYNSTQSTGKTATDGLRWIIFPPREETRHCCCEWDRTGWRMRDGNQL
jgi:hypothetical protein